MRTSSASSCGGKHYCLCCGGWSAIQRQQRRVHAEFLVDRSWRSTRLAVALHWALLIDCEEAAAAPRIAAIQTRLYSQLQRHNPSGHDAITGQMRLKALLDRFGKEVRTSRCPAVPCCCSHGPHARACKDTFWERCGVAGTPPGVWPPGL